MYMLKQSYTHKLGLLLLAAACYFPIFLHLDSFPIYLWDEARAANNAFEMIENGNLIVTYYNGRPDMWNSKPSLLPALQAGTMLLLKNNELAVRLPGALVAIFTLILLFHFCKKHLKIEEIGILAVLVLVVSPGYVGLHVVRSGDTDVLLVGWVTLYSLSYFRYLHQSEKRFLWGIFLGLFLGGLTKGVAAFMPLPGLLIYTLIAGKEVRKKLFDKRLYIAGGLALMGILGYYFLREQMNPGYLIKVWENELGGRYMRTEASLEAVNYDYGYYFKRMVQNRYPVLIYLLPIMALFALRAANRNIRQVALFCVVFCGCLLVILSQSTTKHHWYDAPLYPMMALLMGGGFWEICRRIFASFSPRKVRVFTLAIGLILLAPAYRHILAKVTDRHQIRTTEFEGGFMSQLVGEKWATSYTVVKDVQYAFHLGQIHFYRKTISKEFGHDIRIKTDLNGIKTGEYLMACQPAIMEKLSQRFDYEVIAEWRTCSYVKIGTKK